MGCYSNRRLLQIAAIRAGTDNATQILPTQEEKEEEAAVVDNTQILGEVSENNREELPESGSLWDQTTEWSGKRVTQRYLDSSTHFPALVLRQWLILHRGYVVEQLRLEREELSESGSLWDQITEIVKFSGPVVGLWLCGPLMSLIDTAVVGQSSSVELAALGPGTVFSDCASYLFMFLSIATSNLVATSLARQDKSEVQHQISILLFWTGLWYHDASLYKVLWPLGIDR
ncbi:UNVERIFIED_CONTAM: protein DETOXIFICATION 47, chloroplastic [Sesamum calycinum]|uniref:Protein DETOXIFICATION 47, chloroplastic n=1 Tax=Sesamum calycinum TaxID=2727403 RepID=A0AAW2JWK0_9LAMI